MEAVPAPDAPAGAAAASAAAAAAPSSGSSHAPDAPDASVGEALPPVTASAADLAAAAAADSPAGGVAAAANDSGTSSGRRRRANVLTVPGTGLRTAAAAAVVPAQTTQITVYEFCNYGGRFGVVGAGDNHNLQGTWNDRISSVRVPAGMTATFWEHPNYGGRGFIFRGPADFPCLDGIQFSRVISSFKITMTNNGGNGGGSNGGGSNGGGGSGGGGNPGGSGGVDSQLLSLVNTARSRAGLRPLSIDSRLNAAALVHSQDQARRQQHGHTGSDGSSAGTRMTQAGYTWRLSGENVAAGQSTAQSVFDAWMNSPGHRANIMTPDFVHMGAAMATSNRPYWTQVFGAPM